jgi:hypothetical protein
LVYEEELVVDMVVNLMTDLTLDFAMNLPMKFDPTQPLFALHPGVERCGNQSDFADD